LLSQGDAVDSVDDIDNERILETVEIPADTVATTSFDAPPPRTYQIVCTVPGHLEEGMTASLTVAG
jgi:uncharacterized cupredoxin-like copper-binding protein